jgi:hypothetical protein
VILTTEKIGAAELLGLSRNPVETMRRSAHSIAVATRMASLVVSPRKGGIADTIARRACNMRPAQAAPQDWFLSHSRFEI